MGFKSLSQYQTDKQGEFFVLPNDGDSADVVFLYRSVDDVLVADVHWISSPDYKGYAFCLGRGCPGCAYGEHGLRIDHKIFIPLFNIGKNKIEFWDRSTFFEQVLQKDVFRPFPDPSQTVFRVTRRGEAGSRDTKYDIKPIGLNGKMPYEKILADFNIQLPAYYSTIVKDMSAHEMDLCLNSTSSVSTLEDYGYTPVPRGSLNQTMTEPIPSIDVPTVEYSAPPQVAPPTADSPAVTLPEYNPDAEISSEVPQAASQDALADDSTDLLDNVQF